ncbi:MAG: hypothetical protein ACRDP8_19105 [Actinopolymorphaceae bacterium]
MADTALAPGGPTLASVDLVDLAGVDLAGTDRARRTLLVVTAEPRAASASLRLPFTRARVAGDDDLDDAEALAETCFDTVVIDGPALGPERRDLAATWAGEHVRPDGRVVILLEPSAGGPDARGTLTGLAWLGVGTLDGHPCAVLRPTDRAARREDGEAADDIAGRLAAAGQTLLAMPRTERPATWPAAPGNGQAGNGHAGNERAADDERARRDRAESESALLHHLRGLVKELTAERRLRIAAEARHRTLEHRHQTLQTRYARLRDSKLGSATVRYWQLRKDLRRRWNG